MSSCTAEGELDSGIVFHQDAKLASYDTEVEGQEVDGDINYNAAQQLRQLRYTLILTLASNSRDYQYPTKSIGLVSQ